jgi:hypothetical protein
VCAIKGQVIADFTIDYRIKDEENTDYVSVCPWNFYFNGSVYRDEKDVGSILISPNTVVYETSVCLDSLIVVWQIKSEFQCSYLQITIWTDVHI